jgi:hypothetical protein
MGSMSDERRGVIGSLPSTRPHRRSQKRAPAGAGQAETAAERPKPATASRKPATAKAGKRTAAATKPQATKAGPKKASAAAKSSTTKKTPAEPIRATPRRPAAKKPPANVRTRTRPAPAPPAAAAPVAPRPAEEHGTLETVVQAAAELTELGLRAGARALRGAVSRLPRP